MPLEPIPYLLVSQDIPVHVALGVSRDVKVFVCLSLVDHRAIGIAVEREDALDAMREQYEELNPDDPFGELGFSQN